jgi:hypothetical protein
LRKLIPDAEKLRNHPARERTERNARRVKQSGRIGREPRPPAPPPPGPSFEPIARVSDRSAAATGAIEVES